MKVILDAPLCKTALLYICTGKLFMFSIQPIYKELKPCPLELQIDWILFPSNWYFLDKNENKMQCKRYENNAVTCTSAKYLHTTFTMTFCEGKKKIL